MKPAPFAYDDPRDLEEALALLAHYGDDAKVLAGGQSLVPLLNFRLARPARLVDVNRVNELAYLRRTEGTLRIGALTRERALERSELVARGWPLLAQAVRHVGHPQIRARGTIGGSVAHSDPAAELPVALTALEARFHVRSLRGTRTLSADELFVTYLTTALEPDELLVEIEVPPVAAGSGSAFLEQARVHGDFALAGAAVVLSLAESGVCERARIALLAAGPTPLRAPAAEAVLAGVAIDSDAAAEAAQAAVDGDGYRPALLRELVKRALLEAAARAER